jgi:hypothetical protein
MHKTYQAVSPRQRPRPRLHTHLLPRSRLRPRLRLCPCPRPCPHLHSRPCLVGEALSHSSLHARSGERCARTLRAVGDGTRRGGTEAAHNPIEMYTKHLCCMLLMCTKISILYSGTQTSNNWLALAGWPARPGDRYAMPGRAHRSTQLV